VIDDREFRPIRARFDGETVAIYGRTGKAFGRPLAGMRQATCRGPE
jgi:hypothetical protein